MKTDIKSLNEAELIKLMKTWNQPAFRGKQLFEWFHVKLVNDPAEMTNIPISLRNRIREECEITELEIIQKQISQKDQTRKYLLKLEDNNTVESVFMPYKHGNSVCVSSQVGCRMGCAFCASAIGGKIRNLNASEILEQVYEIQKEAGVRVDNVVIMGTGEPLDNYDNVLRFINMLTRENGLRISQRSITLSSCGLVPEIYRLADEDLEITLAISLHAVNDEERQKLMPIAKVYSIEEILKATDYYFEKTGRRISYEYSLVKGINDTRQHALSLAQLLRKRNCHVNLIKVNPINERSFESATDASANEFQNLLEKSGINSTIRREMGRDIDGACGQLRRRLIEQQEDLPEYSDR